MNIAVIFAGGTGQRMNSTALPKQFLMIHGKPILVHTIEKFQATPEVDKIVVVSLADYIPMVEDLKVKFNLNKIVSIVSGGTSGQESIFNGLIEAEKFSNSDKDIVLIHDGVRPIIDVETIKANIDCVRKNGSSITVAKSTETVLLLEKENVENAMDRSKCFLGRAPQSFYLKEILDAHHKANQLNKHDFIDSAMLMKYFGKKLFVVEGPVNNIKVTTPIDFLILRALLDAKENEQIKLV
ncbi:MAG: 2-C-methyl-D-erythritol 4-phosphate cytidylyltransferase [Anaeroplasmataceae bacterium]|nr:2-C-methyl-D-erythritol 4-phosphate cytidylyltransferase [Anaeroplasmataceae bacterium]